MEGHGALSHGLVEGGRGGVGCWDLWLGVGESVSKKGRTTRMERRFLQARNSGVDAGPAKRARMKRLALVFDKFRIFRRW